MSSLKKIAKVVPAIKTYVRWQSSSPYLLLLVRLFLEHGYRVLFFNYSSNFKHKYSETSEETIIKKNILDEV
jgi:hypothetical protein